MAPLRISFLALTLVAIVVGAIAVLGGVRPSHGGALGLLGLYLGFVGLGVAFPGTEIFGPARAGGEPGRGLVALTFDDGPHPVHTRSVLDVLERHGARATFFVVGARAALAPDLVREMKARGHEVGSHSFGHSNAFALLSMGALRDDFRRAKEALAPLLGGPPRLFRSPVGLTNPRIARVVADEGLTFVAWTVRPRDGLPWARASTVRDRLKRRVEDGDVVLLHDWRSDGVPPGVEALEEILEDLRKKGLRPVTLSDLWGRT